MYKKAEAAQSKRSLERLAAKNVRCVEKLLKVNVTQSTSSFFCSNIDVLMKQLHTINKDYSC